MSEWLVLVREMGPQLVMVMVAVDDDFWLGLCRYVKYSQNEPKKRATNVVA
jgi:hypothetical protein